MDYHGRLTSLCILLFLMGCPSRAPHPADCDPDAGPCSSKGAAITLEITPRPVAAMRELTFRVTTNESSGADMVDLSMPGMTMGPNRVALTREAPGAYTGRGVIVRCPSGATLWRAAVYNGDSMLTEYFFDVRR